MQYFLRVNRHYMLFSDKRKLLKSSIILFGEEVDWFKHMGL